MNFKVIFIKTAYAQGPKGGGDCLDHELNTAIGCIPIEANTEFLRFLLQWSMGVAGGFAVLLILYASFLFITSSGDKYKLQSAKQLLTAAIAGLLFLIFSVFMLRVIGVDILGINQLIL